MFFLVGYSFIYSNRMIVKSFDILSIDLLISKS